MSSLSNFTFYKWCETKVAHCNVLSIVSLVIIRADIIRADKVPGHCLTCDSHRVGGSVGRTIFDKRRLRLS